MGDSLQAARSIQKAHQLADLIEQQNARDWLSKAYRRYLHGGWTNEEGRLITRPHTKALAFHAAAKSRFCPECWSHLGFNTNDINQRFYCKSCDREYGMRKLKDDWAGQYELLFISGANQSSKSFSMASEAAGQLIGYRPWDGSLTTLDEEPGDWMYGAPSLRDHFDKTVWQYLEQRIGHYIVDRIQDPSGPRRWKTWILEVPNRHSAGSRLERLHFNSYEQWKHSGKQIASVFEGARYKGAFFDEPPPREVLKGVMRGCMRWQARGEGRVFIAGTSLHDEYLLNTVQQNSWNMGGNNRAFFTITFQTADNPSLTQREIKNFEATLTPEEKEMCLFGRFKTLAGRVYPQFNDNDHVYNDISFDPLTNDDGTPSDWPVVQLIDPHDKRPWVIIYAAISPMNDYYVFKEWPEGDYREMRRHNDAGADGSFESYAKIIEDIETQLPGGPDRIIARYMDPRFGRTQKAGLERSVADEMQRFGYYYQTDMLTTGAVSMVLNKRHATVRSFLRLPDPTAPLSQLNRPKLRVARHACRNTIHGFSNYTNKADPDPEKEMITGVKDLGKDHMDCIGWLCEAEPKFMPWNKNPEWMSAFSGNENRDDWLG